MDRVVFHCLMAKAHSTRYVWIEQLSGGAGRCNAVTNSLSLPMSNATYQAQYSSQQQPKQDANVMRMDCSSSVCYSFRCHLGLIPASSSVYIKITSRLWQRTLIRGKQGLVRLVTRASLTLPAEVMQTNTTNDQVTIELIARPGKDSGAVKEGIEWWIYLAAVLAGLFLLLFVIFVMYKCGFFSRARPDDEKSSPEETKPMRV